MAEPDTPEFSRPFNQGGEVPFGQTPLGTPPVLRGTTRSDSGAGGNRPGVGNLPSDRPGGGDRPGAGNRPGAVTGPVPAIAPAIGLRPALVPAVAGPAAMRSAKRLGS
jgi:hypothetical protein